MRRRRTLLGLELCDLLVVLYGGYKERCAGVSNFDAVRQHLRTAEKALTRVHSLNILIHNTYINTY